MGNSNGADKLAPVVRRPSNAGLDSAAGGKIDVEDVTATSCSSSESDSSKRQDGKDGAALPALPALPRSSSDHVDLSTLKATLPVMDTRRDGTLAMRRHSTIALGAGAVGSAEAQPKSARGHRHTRSASAQLHLAPLLPAAFVAVQDSPSVSPAGSASSSPVAGTRSLSSSNGSKAAKTSGICCFFVCLFS